MEPEIKEWMDRLFGGPVLPDFEGKEEFEEFWEPTQATLIRLTGVFENAGSMLAPYSDESVDQAFWYMNGKVLGALRDESIEWATRDRLIRSFGTLFRELFAVRCRPVFSELDEEGSPPNSSCYMWWDIDSWRFTIDPLAGNHADSAFIASMRSILAIDHIACQESALHGLGHWHRYHAREVETIIDEFLERKFNLPGQLREYAAMARAGAACLSTQDSRHRQFRPGFALRTSMC